MSGNRDEAIRARAYQIWEAEGFPEGREQQHWEQAALEIEQAQAEARAPASPVRRPDRP